jgi:hypothetical protein
MLAELLAQCLPGKRCHIIAGGNRMGEHPPAPILDAKLAADNTEPALRNYATKATLAGRRHLRLDACPLGGGLKHDGFRVIARKSGAQVRLDSVPAMISRIA